MKRLKRMRTGFHNHSDVFLPRHENNDLAIADTEKLPYLQFLHGSCCGNTIQPVCDFHPAFNPMESTCAAKGICCTSNVKRIFPNVQF